MFVFSASFSNALILPESTILCVKPVKRDSPAVSSSVFVLQRPSGGEMQISGASEWKVKKCIIKNKRCKRDGRARDGGGKGNFKR